MIYSSYIMIYNYTININYIVLGPCGQKTASHRTCLLKLILGLSQIDGYSYMIQFLPRSIASILFGGDSGGHLG